MCYIRQHWLLGALKEDQQSVPKTVVVEFCHSGNILCVAVAGVKLHNSVFQSVRQLSHALVSFIWYGVSPPLVLRAFLTFFHWFSSFLMVLICFWLARLDKQKLLSAFGAFGKILGCINSMLK